MTHPRRTALIGGGFLGLALMALSSGPTLAGQITLALGGGGVASSNSLVSELRPDGFLRIDSQPGAAGTLQLTTWLSRRVALEAQALYLSAPLEYSAQVEGQDPIEFEEDGETLAGGVHLLFAFYRPILQPAAVYLSTGLVAVQRGGPLFDAAPLDEETTHIGWSLGLGARRGVARGFYLRVDARDLITSYRPTSDLSSRLQHDLVATAGLEILLVR